MWSYKIIPGIKQITSHYDAYITSIYGVIHDRTSLFPGSRSCLEYLAEAGKTVLIMSNSPKRASTVIQQLAQIGVPPSLYQHILTSGEEAYQHLSSRADPWHATLGKYCYYIGSTDDDDILEELDVYPVSDIRRADFILSVGLDVGYRDEEDYNKLLRQAANYRLPMVCANPDFSIVDGDKRILRAGYLAKKYESYGGQVRYHGKPYAAFYEKALIKLRSSAQERILCIGDSLETDIYGAAKMGLDTAFVNSDSQTRERGVDWDQSLDTDVLEKLFVQFKVEPRYVLPSLQW